MTNGLLTKGVPHFPAWMIYVKIAIIILSVIIVALAAYAISLWNNYTYYYSSGVPGYLIFLAVKSWIIYGATLFVELKAPQFYFRIVFLILYVMSCIFWLSGWGWSASWASYILAAYDSDWKTFGAVMAACAGLGALIWILCCVNLVIFFMTCLRNPDLAQTGNVELGQSQKHAEAQQQQPVFDQSQQQAYPEQPHGQQTYATQ